MNSYDLQTNLQERDLGVTFNANLTFQLHIGNIISKANGRIGIIIRIFNWLDEDNFKTLYKFMVRPILIFCRLIWFHLHKREEIEKSPTKGHKINKHY